MVYSEYLNTSKMYIIYCFKLQSTARIAADEPYNCTERRSVRDWLYPEMDKPPNTIQYLCPKLHLVAVLRVIYHCFTGID